MPHLLIAIGVSLALAGLVTPWLLLPAGLVLGCAAVVWAARRRMPDTAAVADAAGDEAIRKLDRDLRETAALLSEGARANLAELKETLARALRLLRDPEGSGGIPSPERCFVLETVRRYLPDACRHYLALAQAARGDDWEAAKAAAEQSLCRQVHTLRVRLDEVLDNAVARQVQTVLRHETFLRGKRAPRS